MIPDLKPYSEMKDSGVLWLGEMPEHWEVMRGRQLFEIKKQIAGKLGYPVYSVTQAGLRVKDVDSGEGQVSHDYSKYQIVRPSDFAMNSMDLLTGGVGIARSLGVTSPDYRVFKIRDQDQCFEHYVLIAFRLLYQNRAFYGWGQGSAQLGRWRLPRKRFNEFPFPVPPFSEQVAIGDFLAFADRRIRRYIQTKQKLIKLLEEQKQAVVHQAVTRGLDPGVRLKPSGVEWLGDVPEQWEVLLNQRIFKEKIRPHNKQPEIPLSLSQRDGLVATAEMKERSLQTSTYENWKITIPGDIVVNRFKAHLGVFFASTLRGIVSFHYGVFEPRREVVPKFFEHLYHTMPYRAIYAGRSNGMTVGLQNLSNQNFYNVKTVVPPLVEQREIVEYLDQATGEIDWTKDRARREIELLKEYRTRLIADVVTGKLDVREAAAKLHEEPEPVEEVECDSEAEDALEDDLDTVMEDAES